MITADFIATLTYRTSEEGGRSTPAFSGYRPGIQFDFDTMQTSGEQMFLEQDQVFPGGMVKAEIRIVSVDYFAGKLKEGMTFEFKEGAQVIGCGIIDKLLNPKLKYVL